MLAVTNRGCTPQTFGDRMLEMGVAIVPQHRVGTSGPALTAAMWNPGIHGEPSDVVVIHEGIEVPELAGLIGAATRDVRCALHLDLSPRQRREYISALDRIEGLSSIVSVESPVAAFAQGWFRSDSIDIDRPLRVVAVGHEGSCGVVFADTRSRHLVSIALADSTDALAELTLRAVRLCGGEPGDGESPRWASVLDRVAQVQTFGLDDAWRVRFDDLYGGAVEHGPESGVLDGLTRLRLLSDWSAAWPTTRVHIGTGWTRQPGPFRTTAEDHVVRLREGAGLWFSDAAGSPVPVRAGSVLAAGCVIPARLGTQPRLRFVDDGSVLVLGPGDERPVAMRLRWPIPASGNLVVDLRARSSAGVELLEPRIHQPTSVPEHLHQVEPELSGHT